MPDKPVASPSRSSSTSVPLPAGITAPVNENAMTALPLAETAKPTSQAEEEVVEPSEVEILDPDSPEENKKK